MKSPRFKNKNAVLVDFTVWLLERQWGTTLYSGEQRSHAGQLVSEYPHHLLSCVKKKIWNHYNALTIENAKCSYNNLCSWIHIYCVAKAVRSGVTSTEHIAKLFLAS